VLIFFFFVNISSIQSPDQLLDICGSNNVLVLVSFLAGWDCFFSVFAWNLIRETSLLEFLIAYLNYVGEM
jgi:hypothetical protein